MTVSEDPVFPPELLFVTRREGIRGRGGQQGTCRRSSFAPTREDDAGPERWVTCPRPAMVGGEAGAASQLLEQKAMRFRTSLCTNLQLTVSYILYIS